VDGELSDRRELLIDLGPVQGCVELIDRADREDRPFAPVREHGRAGSGNGPSAGQPGSPKETWNVALKNHGNYDLY
jgi:hypothetical protein